jgi:acyl-CoA thioesterase-1
MNGLVYHIASGQAFFSGITLVLFAVAIATLTRPSGRRLASVAGVVGVLVIGVSSTPQPLWCYAIAAGLAVTWLGTLFQKNPQRWPRYAVAFAGMALALLELPHHMTPRIVPTTGRSLTILGDSVTAGWGAADKAERWPNILSREHDVAVQDLSHVGETAASAAQRAARQSIVSNLVLVEIGGNDVLGSTSAEQFAVDLDALLANVCSADRQVIMFELPLPPFYHEYGRIQRTLAREHGVALVPKRTLLSILAPRENTVDTIHLTQAGHRQMAAQVWRLVGLAYVEREPR